MNFAGGRLASAPVSLYSCDFGTSVRHITSMSILYQLFELSHKKCTEGHLPCTNGIANIQKAGMKRCGRLLPKLLQRQHNLRHKHPRLILSVNVPAILFNHQIDPF